MLTERPFDESLGETFKANVHDLRPQNSPDEQKRTPELRLASLNSALGTVSTLYKNNDLMGTVKAFACIIANASPMATDYLKRTSTIAPVNITEETMIYTLCQAANDAAKVCFTISNSYDLTEEIKDRITALSLCFIEKQINWGTLLGDETITLRALNNSTQINTDRAMRHFYQEGSSPENKAKAREIVSSQIKKTKDLLRWAKTTRSLGSKERSSKIEFISALEDGKIRPASDNQLSLKYITNSLNRLGVLNLHLADMTSYPNVPTDQIFEARKALEVAHQFHLKYLEDKEPGRELEQRKLAIHSNLGYSYIMEMFRTKNFNSVNLNELHQIMDNIHNNFIKNFLNPLGFLDKKDNLSEKEVTKLQSFFRMESITRSLEILGIMLLSHTNRSTTLSREYQNLEMAVYNSILAHFKIRPNIEKSIGEFNLLTRTAYIREAAIILRDMGEAYLKKEGSTTDNEDRIFFNKALESLKSEFEVKTPLNWPQI